jgi:hypothetical protein
VGGGPSRVGHVSPPAIAVGGTLDDNVYVTDDTSGEPFPPTPAELLDYLRQIANHDDVPDTVQADARDYLQYLEAASSGPGGLIQRLPRPRFGAS